MVETLVVVVMLPSLLSPFIVSKLFVPGGEDAGSFSKFKLGVPEPIECLSDLLFSLLQHSLGSCSTPFHHVQPQDFPLEACLSHLLKGFLLVSLFLSVL